MREHQAAVRHAAPAAHVCRSARGGKVACTAQQAGGQGCEQQQARHGAAEICGLPRSAPLQDPATQATPPASRSCTLMTSHSPSGASAAVAARSRSAAATAASSCAPSSVACASTASVRPSLRSAAACGCGGTGRGWR